MSEAGASPPVVVARVVPDVTGLDKQFDYLVPDEMVSLVSVGTRVRVPLHGRRVGGWVVALGGPDPDVPVARLVPIAQVSSLGPPTEVVDLARWAAERWGTGRLRPFLVAASSPTMVRALARGRRTIVAHGGAEPSGVVVVPPLVDPLGVVVEAAAAGPTLVVHPAPAAARAIASRLRKQGLTVALVPDEWAAAAAGVDVVVGGRTAVWAPCPGLSSIVVLDEHDESLQEERSPTWHARDVAIERARAGGARCVLVSPCPTGHALHWAGSRIRVPTPDDARVGWPAIVVVDRGADEVWSHSLLSSELIECLRDRNRRVACVLNTRGRARLLACRSCRAVQRCSVCDAVVGQDDARRLVCGRCSSTRPQVCASCGATAMALVRPGVTRLRDELEAAAARPVVAVTGDLRDDRALSESADVFIGTEAVLHRVRSLDVVAFLEFDSELLAPRYRAAEQALGLLARAGRLVGPASGGGQVLVQTFVPDHPVLHAAASGDTTGAWERTSAERALLGLPPCRALAEIDGAEAEEFARATGLEVAVRDGSALVRADDWSTLGAALAATERPKGSRLRVAVDPPRV